MPEIIVYHHDPVEVDPSTSWTGLCSSLKNASRVNIRLANEPHIIELFDYARPDAVIAIDNKPAISIEQTRMNPSGHNIPQRFSCLVRAAELGIPSILYYPEYSRRTFSDPNVRYLQVRVPLAQLRLSRIYGIPSLSVFWPTDIHSKLPQTGQKVHYEIAALVDALVLNYSHKEKLIEIPEVVAAIAKMEDVIAKYANRYRPNPSVRRLLKNGFPSASVSLEGTTNIGVARERQPKYQIRPVLSIDPPEAARLVKTVDFLKGLVVSKKASDGWKEIEQKLMLRPFTLLFTGTANKDKSDSEHPWPGYLTLLDILYLRTERGRLTSSRTANLVYRLPVNATSFLFRINQDTPPTPSYIIDTFVDVMLLDGGIITGRPIRGNRPAELY